MLQVKELSSMTPEQFVYWLQGFFELAGDCAFSKREQIIKDHLQEVFHKKTPTYTYTDTAQKNIPNEQEAWIGNKPPAFIC